MMPFKSGGRVRLHLPKEEVRFAPDHGWNALIIAPPAPRVCRRRAARAGGRLTMLPTGRDARSAAMVPAGAAVFEMRHDFVEEACAKAPLSIQHAVETSNRKIGVLAERLLGLEREGAGGDVVMDVLWAALARGVGAHFGDMWPRSGDGWLNPGALLRAVEFVEAGIDGALRVASMGEVAGLGPSAFLRAFRGSTGVTPGEFVLRRRISVGATLLAITDLPIGEIARRTGFKSGNHFATTFALRRGMSPSAFRRTRRPVPA